MVPVMNCSEISDMFEDTGKERKKKMKDDEKLRPSFLMNFLRAWGVHQ